MSEQFLVEQRAFEVAEEILQPKLDVPRKYKVVLVNDDYSPMDFVVDVLRRFFHLSESLAEHIMMEIHTQGKGVGGIYTHEIAETKVAHVREYAKLNEHPLLCKMEPV